MVKRLKENGKQITITLHEVLYYMFFSILLFAKGIGLYEGMLSFNICIVLAVGCFIGAMILNRYSLKEWTVIIGCLICSFIAYSISGEKAIIITCLVIFGMKNIPINRIMRIAFVIWTITFYGMLFIHLAGWKEEIILAHNKFGFGFLLRHSLGFPHPNVLHISFVIWMALFFYVHKISNKQLLKVSVWFAIENAFIFLFSISITGFALGIIYLILNCYFAVRKDLTLPERVVIKSVLPLSIFGCIIPPLIFEGKLFDIFNILLNTRMNIWNYYLTTFRPGIFGTKVFSPESGAMSLDSSYLYLLYYYGIILFLVIMGTMHWTINRYVNKNKLLELAIIMSMLVAGIVEPFLFNFSFKNLILIFMGHEIFESINEKSNKEVVICPLTNKEMTLDVLKLRDIKTETVTRMKSAKKTCIVIGLLIGLLAGIYTVNTYEKPKEIYVQNHRCDYVSGSGITVEEIPNKDNCWILGYQNDETRFYSFSGNMITLEYFRAIIINVIFGYCIGSIIVLAGNCVLVKIKQVRDNR